MAPQKINTRITSIKNTLKIITTTALIKIKESLLHIFKNVSKPTRNSAKDVMKPSLVSSHVPPYSSSSIC